MSAWGVVVPNGDVFTVQSESVAWREGIHPRRPVRWCTGCGSWQPPTHQHAAASSELPQEPPC